MEEQFVNRAVTGRAGGAPWRRGETPPQAEDAALRPMSAAALLRARLCEGPRAAGVRQAAAKDRRDGSALQQDPIGD